MTEVEALGLGPGLAPGPHAWILLAARAPLQQAAWEIAQQATATRQRGEQVDGAVPGALIQDVVPPLLRRRLGEFYTPLWLAQLPAFFVVSSLHDQLC